MSIKVEAQLVNQLRSITEAGLMDCKKALVSCNGNLEEAIKLLRTKGLASAAKKSGRDVNEGSVAIAKNDLKSVVIKLSCETDFVAKNDKFQSLIKSLAELGLRSNATNLDSFLETKTETGIIIKDYILQNIAIMGENLTLQGFASIESGLIFNYIHNRYSDSTGKICVLVSFTSNSTYDDLKELGQKIGMHIAAMKPIALNIEDVDQTIVENEKNIFEIQAKESGKPSAVIEKMVEGRIRKFYEENVLNEQISMFDGKTKIRDLIKEYEQQLGTKIDLKSFVRFEVGTIT